MNSTMTMGRPQGPSRRLISSSSIWSAKPVTLAITMIATTPTSSASDTQMVRQAAESMLFRKAKSFFMRGRDMRRRFGSVKNR